MFEISSYMVMPDLQTQEIPLTLAQPGAQGTNQIPDFVKWTSGYDMRDFFSSPVWVCQDSWACLCPTLPLVSKNQQVQTLPEALAFPLHSALRVQSLLHAWLTWEILPVTVNEGGVSHRDGVTREAYSHRGSFICFVCLITWL